MTAMTTEPIRIPVQVRFEPELHAQVAEIAAKLHLPRNAAYQMLIELGIASLVEVERRELPLRVVENGPDA